MPLAKDESTIRQTTNGVTLAAGTANQDSIVLDYAQPNYTGFKIRAGDKIALYMSDTTPTAIASTSYVKIMKTDALGRGTKIIADGDYALFAASFTDRNNVFIVAAPVGIDAGQHLKVSVNANLAVSTAYLRVTITGQLAYPTVNS